MTEPEKDAFDQWWEWATSGRATDFSTLPPEIYNAVMTLTPEERADRAIVNEAVRLQMSPLRPRGVQSGMVCRRRRNSIRKF
jgi:hypothetical protein